MRTFDEIYAYLEAHIHKSNRVQIVVEEFLGMHDEEDASRTPSPNFRLPEPEDPGGNDDNIDFSGKGKGVGKNSNSFRPVKVPESDESVSTSSTGAKIVSPVAIKRSLSEPIASASSSSSQPKKIKEETNDGAEITALADNLIAMFPETPLSYIRARCIDLAGKPAAIERFTEELLLDPNPPSNWASFPGPSTSRFGVMNNFR